MTLDHLQSIINEGKFHHATYRDHGTIWEGLWIYIKSDDRIGYKPAGSFSKVDTDLDKAHDLVKFSGICVGAYGRG